MAITERMKKKSTKSLIPADFGTAGAPIDRRHPFYFGFVATVGALTAFVLMRALASASQVFVLILVALFLATGLNPAVEAIRKRGVSRTTAVSIIFTSVIFLVILFGALVVPPLVTQGTQLIETAPALLNQLKDNATIASINTQYGVIDSLQTKLSEVTSDGALLFSAFGGVIGVGKSVLSGTFTALTILVLLTEAVIARVGAFVGSQILVSAMAALFMTLLALLLGLPSPIAIGIIIFVCGLVPLIGHFIGSAIYTIIAFTQSISIGVIAFIGYVVYVQIENYILTPKIIKRSLNVPGAVTIISALIGTSLLGLVGGLLAVPIAASVILILEEVVFPRAEKS
jgi:predicted PurR-regulated permease PerM